MMMVSGSTSAPNQGGRDVLAWYQHRGPQKHINIRILQTVVSGIPLSWGLEPGGRICCVSVVSSASILNRSLTPPYQGLADCRDDGVRVGLDGGPVDVVGLVADP